MEPILQFEINFILALQNMGEWLVTFMKGITFLGNEDFFIMIMPLIYWCIDSQLGIRLGIMLLYSSAFTSAFKMGFHSPRPSWVSEDIVPHVFETSFGLPSGHSSMAASIWGLLATTFKKNWQKILTVLVIFLIGFSRLVLGAHLVRDVLSGWLIGALFLLVFLKLEKPVGNWLKTLNIKQKLFVAFLGTLIMLLPAILTQRIQYTWTIPADWVNTAGYPIAPFSLEGVFAVAGTFLGFGIGLPLLEHYQKNFTTNGPIFQRALRFTLGIIGVLILRFGLKLILPGGDEMLGLIMKMVRYTVIGFWVSFLAPLMFQKIGIMEKSV